MDDSADEAVPEAGAARGRPPVANVPAGNARGRDSQREPDPFHRLVPFKKAGAGSARQPLSWFEQLFAYGSHAALAVCLFGFAWAAGSYFSGGRPPFSPLKAPITRTIAPQDSAERIELLRTAQKMAEDIRALKVDVEALRAAQSLTAKDTAGIAGLKTRLDAVKPKPAPRSPSLRARSSACSANRRPSYPNYPAARSYGRPTRYAACRRIVRRRPGTGKGGVRKTGAHCGGEAAD